MMIECSQSTSSFHGMNPAVWKIPEFEPPCFASALFNYPQQSSRYSVMMSSSDPCLVLVLHPISEIFLSLIISISLSLSLLLETVDQPKSELLALFTMKTAALSLLLSSGCAAFAPASFGRSRSNSALHVSAVRELINKRAAARSTTGTGTQKPIIDDTAALVLEAFETQTPESVGVKGPGIQSSSSVPEALVKEPRRKSSRNRRKHNFQQQAHLQETPDLDFFTLHSSAVSHLQKDMPVNDIVRAIKRAQNLHDVHDLATIASFLIDHCDEHWGFGYRGSLLSRLAVAALHAGEVETASRAIEARRIYERPSMQPHESAAIVRGLMRVGQVEKGWEVLNDELRLPMQGLSLKEEANQEVLKQRAHTLASIASRHFYEGEPYLAAKAISELGALGSVISESPIKSADLNMPWARLITAATVCGDKLSKNEWDVKHLNGQLILSLDLAELVWDAMYQFPCPDDGEECSLEDYFLAIV